jgi:soluble lytic murein transglycosylase
VTLFAARPLPILALTALVALCTGPDRLTLAQSALGPTQHAALPASESDLWLVPAAADRTSRANPTAQTLAAAVKFYDSGEYSAAQAALSRLQPSPALLDYVDYYKGLVQLQLNQYPEARRILEALAARKPAGAISLNAALALGETAEKSGRVADAIEIYRRIADDRHLVSDDVLSRLGAVAMSAGDRKTAAQAYLRVYYEFALSDLATAAASHLATLQDQIVKTGYRQDLGRAAMLFGARRYAEARTAFQEIQKQAGGDDRELADLRVAESDFHLKRYAAARDGVRPYLERASRKAEARFFHLSALRELGQHDEYIAQTRALVADFPGDTWAEESLNNLGTHYILTDEDEAAARVFGELYEKFPTGSRAERAAWKYGWWSYRNADYANAVKTFESASAAFPRSDYRPSFLYWAARAHGKLGQGETAGARYRLVHHDYGSSYYGRLALRRVDRRSPGQPEADRTVAASLQPVTSTAPRPPTADRIRLLLANGLYDAAISELRYAQRQWGTSPAIEATIAWAYHQKGELRRAITLMRRAYPQSLTSGGHLLPVEIRQVIFPLVYWDLIRKHANTYDLDPYVMAALIAQESTFDADVRSVANAWGLMQIVPATGRRLARNLGIRRFSTSTLTNPEVNIRMGMLYFSQLVRQFGGTHYALASYNAGENRVVRWKAERPGVDEDEFIDDIPFPETQNYVKRILGTAEDYRLLYGRDGGRPRSATELRR